MQEDMHYYGVYVLARAAGINAETAGRIADASQFVDDYTLEDGRQTCDGALISNYASGHSIVCDSHIDPLNLEKVDAHNVWVPFHFIPGNKGASYEDRMKCSMDSGLAQEMLDEVLKRFAGEAFAPELIGVMAHIYADTFSHWGFSGLRSDGNLVDPASIELIDVRDHNILDYIKDKAWGYFGKLSGAAAGTATQGLGHASVADYPDRPYLKWQFQYLHGPASPVHDNQATYLVASEKLFNFFKAFKLLNPAQYAEENVDRNFTDIEDIVKGILAFEGKKDERANEWIEAAKEEPFSFSGDFRRYKNTINQGIDDSTGKYMADVMNGNVWNFTRAIEVVRGMIMYQVLPKNGLIG